MNENLEGKNAVVIGDASATGRSSRPQAPRRAAAPSFGASGLLAGLLVSIAACAPVDGGEPGSRDAVAAAEEVESGSDALSTDALLQTTLGSLANCYAAGIDALGVGDLAAGTNTLKACFAPNAPFVLTFPPAYAFFDYTAPGPEDFASHVFGIFQSNGFVRTQHHVTNVVVQKTGWNAATMRSYITAAHVLPDESVLNITARYVDDVKLMNGKWTITNRQIFGTSVTHLPAFSTGQ